MYKYYKDQQKKISYIERVNMEKTKKDINDKKALELSIIEQELQEKLKNTERMLKSRRNGE